MNKKILFGVAAMGILGMVGAGIRLANIGAMTEVNAETNSSVDIYLNFSSIDWSSAGPGIHAWTNGTDWAGKWDDAQLSNMVKDGDLYHYTVNYNDSLGGILIRWYQSSTDKYFKTEDLCPAGGFINGKTYYVDIGKFYYDYEENHVYHAYISEQRDSTVWLYDVNNYYEVNGASHTAYVYEFLGEHTKNANYPGAAMTVEADLGGANLYSYTYENSTFTTLLFNGGGTDDQANSTKTADTAIQDGMAYVIDCKAENDWNKNLKIYTKKALDFVYGSMHMHDYTVASGLCKTYYGPAATAFAALTSTDIDCITTNYPEVWDRLYEWADANGHSFDKDDKILSSKQMNDMGSTVSNDMSIVVPAIIAGSALAIGGLFLLRKKRAE